MGMDTQGVHERNSLNANSYQSSWKLDTPTDVGGLMRMLLSHGSVRSRSICSECTRCQMALCVSMPETTAYPNLLSWRAS